MIDSLSQKMTFKTSFFQTLNFKGRNNIKPFYAFLDNRDKASLTVTMGN
jgi:hypothetical protein